MVYCKCCDLERKNMSVHEQSIRHFKIKQLWNLLESIDDIHEKQNLMKLIIDKRLKNKLQNQKQIEYRQRYYEENVKGKHIKVRDIEPKPCYLVEKSQIVRADGTVEYRETWKERDCRYKKKSK